MISFQPVFFFLKNSLVPFLVQNGKMNISETQFSKSDRFYAVVSLPIRRQESILSSLNKNAANIYFPVLTWEGKVRVDFSEKTKLVEY